MRFAQHTRAQIPVLRIVQHFLALQVTNKDANRARGGQVVSAMSSDLAFCIPEVVEVVVI